jgi:hypothetical protein
MRVSPWLAQSWRARPPVLDYVVTPNDVCHSERAQPGAHAVGA